MKRTIAVLAALALTLVLGASQALAAKSPGNAQHTSVQLLAINDLHGHLAPTTPGTVQVGCCNPVLTNGGSDRLDAEDGARRRHRVSRHAHQDASHRELQHDHRRRRRPDRREPARVRALPRRADDRGAELDRPGRRRGRQPRVRRGRSRAPAHADGGLSSGRRVPGRSPFAGAFFQYLAANVFYEGTDETILPEYEVQDGRRQEDRLHRADPRGHADDRDADRGRGPRVPARGRDGQRARPRAQEGAGRQGVRRPDPPGRHAGAAGAGVPRSGRPARRVRRRQPVRRTSTGRRSRASRTVSTPREGDHQRPHAPAVHLHDRRTSSSRARRRSAAWSRTSTSAIDPGEQRDDRKCGQPHRHAERRARSRRPRRSSRSTPTLSAPLANKVVGEITADILSARGTPNGQNAAGEQPMGDVIADAMLEATAPTDFGGAVAAFMNAGGVRASLLFARSPGGEPPGAGHLRRGIQRAAVRQHARRQDVHGPADLRRARAAVQQPVGGQQPASCWPRRTSTTTGRQPAGRTSWTARCRSTTERRS